MTCPRCEITAAERASRVTGLAYVLTAGGFRPMAPGADPFAGAVMADEDETRAVRRRSPTRYKPGDQLKPCGTHAAHNRHKQRGEPIDDACRDAERDYRAMRARLQRRMSTRRPQPVLTSPAGSPMLISVAGEGGLAAETVDQACRSDDAGLAV